MGQGGTVVHTKTHEQGQTTVKIEAQIARFVKTLCAKWGIIVAKFDSCDRKAIMHKVLEITAQRRLLQSPVDACQLINVLRATSRIDGDIAEVGTAGGGSARLIAEYAGDKTVHVFDTFEGLPKPGALDRQLVEGSYRWSLGEVQRYLRGWRIEFHKGLFPGSASAVRDHHFSFVHTDVDLYQSTLDCLKFFYPRMNSGGII